MEIELSNNEVVKESESLEDFPIKKESTAPPSVDAELGESDNAAEHISEEKQKMGKREEFLTKLFGPDYKCSEAIFVVFAACLIALNSGFVNGVCMSGLFINPSSHGPSTDSDPHAQMVAGFAGDFTNTAIAIFDQNWDKVIYNILLIVSYMIGAFISALMNPRAKPYVIEPTYGPTFLIGGTMLLLASIFARLAYPTKLVFYLVSASNGIQNGVASIYSANLIRCTLTGAVTDIAIVIGQCIHGNYDGAMRATVLTLIVVFFWVGGLISYHVVRAFTSDTLFINAVLFYMIVVVQAIYLIKKFGVSFKDAALGTWQWKNVLQKLHSGDGKLTQEDLIGIFNKIDEEGGANGKISADELRYGLKRAKVEMTDFEVETLFRAADDDGNGVIDKDEWDSLVKKVL